jgi:Tfp pilus assembly protein FimT
MALTVSFSLFLLSGIMRHNAYTLTEVVLVVAFLGIMAAVAIPRLPFDLVYMKKTQGEAQRLVGDLRRIRSMALRDAATNTNGYGMVIDSDGYEINNLDLNETLDTHTFNVNTTVNPGASKYDFGPLGNLILGQDTEITVSYEGGSYKISFVAATGAVVLTEG